MTKLRIRISVLVLITVTILATSPTISKGETIPTPQSEEKFINKKIQGYNFAATVTAKKDDRAQLLKKFLKKNRSPMANDATKLVKIADKYNLDWKLLPAIAGVESQYGNMVPSGSYNPYGWNNGKAYFQNWSDASETVALGIRTRYVSTGIVTPYKIGPSYAANPAWASHVANYMYQIDQI